MSHHGVTKHWNDNRKVSKLLGTLGCTSSFPISLSTRRIGDDSLENLFDPFVVCLVNAFKMGEME